MSIAGETNAKEKTTVQHHGNRRFQYSRRLPDPVIHSGTPGRKPAEIAIPILMQQQVCVRSLSSLDSLAQYPPLLHTTSGVALLVTPPRSCSYAPRHWRSVVPDACGTS